MDVIDAEIARLLESLRDGLGGRDLRNMAQRMSAHYRANAPTQAAVEGADSALAYALTRMPATAAAVEATLQELLALAPGFVPQSVLDLGAGPGTASHVAVRHFPLARFALLDNAGPFLDLAKRLARASVHPAINAADIRAQDLQGVDERLPQADLVMASYVMTEAEDSAYLGLVERMFAAARGFLVIVEPGRPRDYARLMQARQVVADAGGVVVAPCPHQMECPLVAPDWCHFAVRLARSRSHRALKQGALGFEDEKFSYLVVARNDVQPPDYARVLAPPESSKHTVSVAVCAPDGTRQVRQFTRREGSYKAARKLGWGDRVSSS